VCVCVREREREREAHEEIVSPYVCFEFRPKKCTYDVMTDENETRENMMRVATEPCKAVCDTFLDAPAPWRGVKAAAAPRAFVGCHAPIRRGCLIPLRRPDGSRSAIFRSAPILQWGRGPGQTHAHQAPLPPRLTSNTRGATFRFQNAPLL
jgi:hypothetical protein